MKIIVVLLGLAAVLSGQYLITTSDSLLSNGADYLILTHPNFTSPLMPLCRLRDSLGLRVRMVQTDLVYSTFSDTSHTKSIRLCMQRVYDYWNPRPTYILLVGDAQRGGGANDYLPVPTFPKFNYDYANGITQHGADNWYVTLSGGDSIPDLIIGRLPVNTPAMCQNVVSKIVSYETTDSAGPWRKTILLNSSTDRQIYADDYLTTYFQPASDSVVKIYESQGNSPSLRTRHIQAINNGAVMIMPACHGTQPPAWMGASYTLFSYTDIASLNNHVYPVSFGRG
jgi:hypothetical protein